MVGLFVYRQKNAGWKFQPNSHTKARAPMVPETCSDGCGDDAQNGGSEPVDINEKIISAVSVLLGGLFLIVHIWTIGIAFSESGLLLSILTVAMPVIAQIFWFFNLWAAEGISHPYCLTVLALFAMWAVFFLLLSLD